MPPPALTDSLRETLAAFEASGPPLTTAEVAERLDLGRRSTYDRLDRLVERGLLETKSVGASGRVWWQPDARSDASAGTVRSGDDGPERELEKAKRRYRTLVENVPDGLVALFDDDLRYTLVGGRLFEEFDVDPEELAGGPVAPKVDDPEARQRLIDRYRRTLDGEEASFEFEWDSRTYEVQVTPVRDDAGEVFAGMVMWQDVTERKERERALERSERRTRTLMDNFPNGVVALVDEDLRYVTLGGRSFVGMDETAEDLEGLTVEEALPPGPAEAFARNYRAALDGEAGTFEVEFGDEVRHVHALPVTDADGEVVAAMGMSQDVTDRRERERELERSERRYRTLAENYPDGLMALFDEDLRYTLVGGRLLEQFGVDPEALEGGPVGAVVEDDAARERLERHYRRAFDGETSKFEFEWGNRTFLMRVTPVTDEDGEVFAGMVASQDVTERRERERELEFQREQLAALNNLNRVVRDIAEAVIDQSTRADIERTVCETLAGTDSYEFAWIADVDPATDTIEKRIEAGVDGYVDSISLSTDADDPTGQGPAGRAVRTNEVATTGNVFEDPEFEPWREAAREYGYRATVAIPIVHEGVRYGVLCVYADREHAFEGEEGEMLVQLGQVVSHAIASVERKRALTSDEMVELQLHVPDVLGAWDVEDPATGRVSLDQSVPTTGGEHLVYATATPDALELLETMVSAFPYWEELTVIDDGDPLRVQVRLSASPLLSEVASLGGDVDEAVVEDGDYHLRLRFAPGVDARQVVDAVRDTYPTAEMVSYRQVTRSDDPTDRHAHVFEELTDRQRNALEAAYRSGFFQWPKASTGEEIAAAMGVTGATFHQHLRRAQQKLLGSLLDAPGGRANGDGGGGEAHPFRAGEP